MSWLRDFHEDERGFLLPILGLLAKAVPILGGVAAGLSAYQSITESPGGFRVQPQVTPTRALAPIPRTRSEMERVQGFTQAITPGFAGAGGDGFFRRRRMNPLNPRALARSIRRVKAFSKFAKRVGSYTDPGRSYKLKGFRRKAKR